MINRSMELTYRQQQTNPLHDVTHELGLLVAQDFFWKSDPGKHGKE